MRRQLLNIAISILAIHMLLASSTAGASSNFVQIGLPNNVSIEIPRNWIVLSANQRITLDSAVESRLDLSGLKIDASTLPFAANLYDDSGATIGMVNIRFYPGIDLSQADVIASTTNDVIELDKVLKRQALASVKGTGIRVTSWNGTKLSEINGITVFVTEYTRTARDGVNQFIVRLVRVFASDQSFTLTVSYKDSVEVLVGPITDRIIGSLIWAPK